MHAGRLPLTQSRGGGAAGVYEDVDQTQPYESIQNPTLCQGTITTPAREPPLHQPQGMDNSPCLASAISLDATQPADSRHFSPCSMPPSHSCVMRPSPDTVCHNAAGSKDPVSHRGASRATEQPEDPLRVSSKIANAQQMSIPDVPGGGSTPTAVALIPGGGLNQPFAFQNRDQPRGPSLYVPPSTPSTSRDPSSATPAQPKSRLSMASNPSSLPPGPSPQQYLGISNLTRGASNLDEGEGVTKLQGMDGQALNMQGWKHLVPTLLQQDLNTFKAFIGSSPEHSSLSQVSCSKIVCWLRPFCTAGFKKPVRGSLA